LQSVDFLLRFMRWTWTTSINYLLALKRIVGLLFACILYRTSFCSFTPISRPYLPNGRAYGTSCLSVCLSVFLFVYYGCTVAKRCETEPRLLL